MIPRSILLSLFACLCLGLLVCLGGWNYAAAAAPGQVNQVSAWEPGGGGMAGPDSQKKVGTMNEGIGLLCQMGGMMEGGNCGPGGGAGPGGQGGRGGWYCPWMNQQTGSPVARPGQPLSADQAKALVEQDIRGNPNLKAGKVISKDDAYEVDIVTKDGSLVDKIQVNKQTGWFRSVH